MDYKEKYEQALAKAQELIINENGMVRVDRTLLEDIFPVLKESEGERIRKGLIAIISDFESLYLQENYALSKEDAIAWLETQGVYANFRNGIQIGDKVTRNEDGVLVNLSQLNRVAKPSDDIDTKKQGEKGTNGNEREIPFTDWSEKDETVLNNLIYALANDRIGNNRDEYVDWLKSLKDRIDNFDDGYKVGFSAAKHNQWKPSDEQMNALNYVVNLMASSERPTENDLYYNILKSLRQQLKKLKG